MSTATRDRLLDAALRAFASRGVDGTPITDLEDAAGLAPGSGGFYRYFKTKDEVLTEVIHREIDRVVAQHTTVPDDVPNGDAHGTVAESLNAMLRTLRTLSPLMAILAREQERIGDLATQVSDRLLEGGLRHDSLRLAELLGETDADIARQQAAVIISALVGYTLTCDYFGTPPGGVGRADFVSTLTDLVVPPVRS